MSDRVKMKHVREAEICATGLRGFCQPNGIDMRKLAREGIPISELEKYDDANLSRVIQIAREDD